MIYHLLVAVGAIAALAGIWTVVQGFARRQSPELCDGSDVLACKSCASERARHCGMKPGEYEE